ncbi:MAG: YczE/YyaS/YitT family protein [Gaiellaceae bacterium]
MAERDIDLGKSTRRALAALRPAPRVPTMPWSAEGSTWRAPPATLAILVLGLCLFGVGEGTLIDAGLGNTPWTVLAQGIAGRTPLDIGAATIAVSIVVLLGWIPLRQTPGIGTIGNVILIGLALDVASRVLPQPRALPWQLLQVGIGIATVGLGGALYLTANLGPGPRDGWMTGIHRRTGIGVATVRTTIEIFALAVGIALGGRAGFGTIAFAVLVGYTLAASFRVMTWAVAGPREHALEPVTQERPVPRD